jgi:hypothetical protein
MNVHVPSEFNSVFVFLYPWKDNVYATLCMFVFLTGYLSLVMYDK